MGKIYFIRHAQASIDSDDYDQLSELGVRQAHILGDHLDKTGFEADTFFSGNLKRQKDTAGIVLKRLGCNGNTGELRVLPEFDEFMGQKIFDVLIADLIKDEPDLAVPLENIYKDSRAFFIIFKKIIRRWLSGNYDTAEFESWKAFRERVGDGLEVVREASRNGGSAAVFTSAGTLSTIMMMVFGFSGEEAMRMSLNIVNSSVSCFNAGPEKMQLSFFNNFSHLELCGDPSFITYR